MNTLDDLIAECRRLGIPVGHESYFDNAIYTILVFLLKRVKK